MSWSHRAAVLLAVCIALIAGSAEAQKPIRIGYPGHSLGAGCTDRRALR